MPCFSDGFHQRDVAMTPLTPILKSRKWPLECSVTSNYFSKCLGLHLRYFYAKLSISKINPTINF